MCIKKTLPFNGKLYLRHIFPDMPCMKRVYFTKTIKRQYTGQKTRNEERSWSRWSTVTFVHPSVYIGIRVLVFQETSPGCFLYHDLENGNGRLYIAWAKRLVGVPSCPFPPRPATPLCAAPPRPVRGMFGFFIRRIIILLIRTFY